MMKLEDCQPKSFTYYSFNNIALDSGLTSVLYNFNNRENKFCIPNALFQSYLILKSVNI